MPAVYILILLASFVNSSLEPYPLGGIFSGRERVSGKRHQPMLAQSTLETLAVASELALTAAWLNPIIWGGKPRKEYQNVSGEALGSAKNT